MDSTYIGKPDNIYDLSPLEANLYTPVLNKWIREVARQTIPAYPMNEEEAQILNSIKEELENAKAQLKETVKKIHEVEEDVAEILKEKAENLRKDITTLEFQYNTHEICQRWLNTPEGQAWLTTIVMFKENDYILKSFIKLLDMQQVDGEGKPMFDDDGNPIYIVPRVYKQRIQSLTLDEYNEIIRKEKALANSMAVMSQGVGVIIAPPRTGKTAFGVFWTYMMRYLFGRKSILDFIPRPPFGDYWLFNEDKVRKEAQKMNALNKGDLEAYLDELKSKVEQEDSDDAAEGIEDDETAKKIKMDTKLKSKEMLWARAYGSLLFRDACAFFDEYSDYFPRLGQGRTRMGAVLFNYHRKWGHNRLLILGATPSIEELDINMCQKFITHHIRVRPLPDDPEHCTQAEIYPASFVYGNSVITAKCAMRPYRFEVWGLQPMDYLNGECHYHQYNTINPQRMKISAKVLEG